MTEVLSQDEMQNMRTFIMETARPLDQAIYRFYFENGSSESVRTELAKYQNEDGGFGHALEPDFRLITSSPLATTVGLQYALEIGLTKDDEVVQKAIRYLQGVFDEQEQRWHAVPSEVNQCAHAPWWNYDESTGRCGVEGTWANPSAEIVGWLHRYKTLVEEQFLASVTNLAMDHLVRLPEVIDHHDFLCYQRLQNELPEDQKSAVLARLSSSLPHTVVLNPEGWEGYGARPLDVVTTKDSVFYSGLEEAVVLNLDFELAEVRKCGHWSPNWSWFGQYPDEWEIAKREWEGSLTVKMLKRLHDFGCIQ